jgi:hypothetical protein
LLLENTNTKKGRVDQHEHVTIHARLMAVIATVRNVGNLSEGARFGLIQEWGLATFFLALPE